MKLPHGVVIGLALICYSAEILPSAHAAPGVQYVRTTSGSVRCLIVGEGAAPADGAGVTCESGAFQQAPSGDDQVRVNAAGHFTWDAANIGGGSGANDLTLNYGQTYRLLGWAINPTSDGTRFTNEVTGHGMFVSLQNVNSF
jgi:hypothetical protein